MRNLITILTTWAFTFNSWAAMTSPPTSVEKQFLSFSNELSNPGFENGFVGWSVTTTAPTITTTSGEVAEGSRALKWNPAGADTLSSPSWSVKTNATGNAVAFIKVLTSDPDYDLQVYDGTNVVNTIDIPTSDSFVVLPINFIGMSATTYKLRISAPGDEDQIIVDSTGLGYAQGYNISSVSQASIVGTASSPGTASCTWTSTSATFANFAADSDCPTLTVTGSAVTPATKVPGVLFNSLAAGEYEVEASFLPATGSSTSCGFRIHDGTTGGSPQYVAGGGSISPAFLSQRFIYSTAQTSITFQIQVVRITGGNNCQLDNSNTTATSVYFKIKKYPSTSETAYAPEMQAMSWSGYHANTCSWARTNTAYGDPTADATCTLSELTNQNFGSVTTYTVTNALPGIVFTPKRSGRYSICATVQSPGAGVNQDFRLYNVTDSVTIAEGHQSGSLDLTTPICGIIVANSTTALTIAIQSRSVSGTVTISTQSTNEGPVHWTLVNISNNFPAPVLVNSVVSSSNGVVKLTSAFITNAGTPTISSQDGSWISSLTDNGVGDTSINATSGTFISNANCTCANATDSGSNTTCSVHTDDVNTIQVRTRNVVTNTAADADFTIICVGAK